MTVKLDEILGLPSVDYWDTDEYQHILGRKRSCNIMRRPISEDKDAAMCARCRQVFEPHAAQHNNIACTVCKRYDQLMNNAKIRERKGGPSASLTLEQFATWFGSHPTRECTYCGIPERFVPLMNFVNVRGAKVNKLTVDRIDNVKPYELGNLALACDGCNSAKSDRPVTDMDVFGRAQRVLWLQTVLQQVRQHLSDPNDVEASAVLFCLEAQVAAIEKTFDRLDKQCDWLQDAILLNECEAVVADEQTLAA